MVASDPSHQSLVWFSREAEEGEYLQRERDELELFLPHLRRATGLSDDLADLHMRVDTANQLMNRTPFGLFFLNVHGAFLYGNRRAHDMLASKDGLLIRDGKLTLRSEEQRKQFDTIFEEFRNSPKPNDWSRDKLSVKRSGGESPYLMVIIPMHLKSGSGRYSGDKVILAQVHDPAGIGKAKVDGLEKFYNLTAAEAEVCQRLYEKKCLSGVAKELGVSVNTAKTHLIRSFRKIGVSSQAELLQQLAVHPKYGW
jgi:DNA-binding CsgD family transcriptional regulator